MYSTADANSHGCPGTGAGHSHTGHITQSHPIPEAGSYDARAHTGADGRSETCSDTGAYASTYSATHAYTRASGFDH